MLHENPNNNKFRYKMLFSARINNWNVQKTVNANYPVLLEQNSYDIKIR